MYVISAFRVGELLCAVTITSGVILPKCIEGIGLKAIVSKA